MTIEESMRTNITEASWALLQCIAIQTRNTRKWQARKVEWAKRASR